jgi:ABC-type uncharacterized transport system substrate-binding protein
MSKLATELVALKPAAIVAGSEPAVLAVHNATRTIPIVMSAVNEDPVALGLADSMRGRVAMSPDSGLKAMFR